MTKLRVLLLLAISATAFSQNKIETVANFGVRAADIAHTCYHMKTVKGWHENWLPTQSCAGVAAIDLGFAGGAFTLDRLLRNKHPHLAHFQIVSAAGAGIAVMVSIRNEHR